MKYVQKKHQKTKTNKQKNQQQRNPSHCHINYYSTITLYNKLRSK